MGAIAAAAIHWMPYRVGPFLAFNAAMVILLLLICHWKGEPPKWRWGE
jgi:hypothetical protein